MRVRLLGTAAGGGFPQWNCNCSNCQGVRFGLVPARSRTQSCVAISADDQHWFLLNASPDIRAQLLSFPLLSPPQGSVRGTAVEGIFLTDADLDHTLGLLVLREGSPLTVYATSPIYQALMEGLNIPSTLACYCSVEWRNPALELSTLCYADGTASGLHYAAFPVAGKPPRYMEHRVASQTGERVGYRFHDEKTGGRLLFLPGVAVLDETVKAQVRDCDGLLLDGTFWSEQEMQDSHVGTTRAGQMGHLPVGGPQGSLHYIATLSIRQKIYTHINNTNPILHEDSSAYATVKKAGVEIGWDGLEFVL